MAKTERKVSERTFVDASGNETDLDKATGLTYEWLADGKVFEWTYGESADADRMLALFGAVTLAGNIASTWANTKTGERADSPITDVVERFAALNEGKWLIEGRRTPSVDLDTLAEAVVAVLATKGKAVTVEAARAKLDDKSVVSATRANSEIWGEYQRLRGRATTVEAVGDLFA